MLKRFKIFISGVQNELAAERRAIKKFISADPLLSEYFDIFLFEDMSATSKSSERAYLAEVRKSDIYVGILGKKYGALDNKGVAPTDAEYREAKQLDKHILIYVQGKNTEDKERDAGVRAMLEDIRHPKHGFSYKRFESTEELTRFVHASIVDFLREQGVVGRGRFDERICERATMLDIDNAKLQWFVEQARTKRRSPLKTKASAREVLTHLDLIRDCGLTNAAVLLFGKRPKKFFLQAEVKCVQLRGTEVHKTFPSYKIYDDNLFEQVDKAVAFVLDAIRQAVVQQTHTPRFQRPFEIPVFAIQEAIVNAVAHRNYNTTAGVQVMAFADRVEIWNSGSLPAELTVEDLRKPHTSYPANPLIANVLYLGDYIQKLGSGTLEMIRQCKVHGIPEPEFVLKRNVEFRTILPRDVFTESALDKIGINERQQKAVVLVKTKGMISLADLKGLFPDVGVRTLNRDLNDLVKKKILKPHGEKKGRRYGF